MTWYKDGKPVRNKPSYKTSYTKDIAVLDVDRVTPEDAGIYKCVATNTVGSVSTTVEVMVAGKHKQLLLLLLLLVASYIARIFVTQ